jgi:hypothetical protein
MLYFRNTNLVRYFQLLFTVVLIMIQVFWDMTSSGLVNRFQCLELLAMFKIRDVYRNNSFFFKKSVIV